MIWTLLAQGLLGLVLFTTVSCVLVKFAMPLVLEALIDPLNETIRLVIALCALPEFWYSTRCRRQGEAPPPGSYAYGDALCWLAIVGHESVRTCLRALARSAENVPAAIVGLLAAAWHLWALMD